MNREQRRKLERQRGKQKISAHASNYQPVPAVNKGIPKENLGPEGFSSELYAVGSEDGDFSKSEAALKDNSERLFQVMLVLRDSYSETSDLRIPPDVESGSSLLSVEGAAAIVLDVNGFRVEVGLNKTRKVSFFKSMVKANSIPAAKKIFVNLIAPSIDHMSFKLNIPIYIGQIVAFDPKNHVHSVDYAPPYSAKLLSASGQVVQELAPIYSLFREAMNAVSPFYRVMCYSKILEGLIVRIRPDVFKRGKMLGLKLSESVLVPEDDELSKFYKKYIGKPVIQLYQSELQGIYRDAVAHFALDNSQPVNLSDYDDRAKFEKIVYVFHICAKVLIENTENCIVKIQAGKVPR